MNTVKNEEYMDDTLKLEANEFLPLRDVVFHTLREAILRGKLKPGERLMEIQLANKLGVSRTPVREAIRMLELEGLVTMVPRKGAAVAGITEKSMKDVLEVRRGMEELCVALACERMTEEGFAALESAALSFERAVAEERDVTALAKADEEFHDIIYLATDNDKLILLISQLREQMYRYRVEHVKDKERRQLIIREHREIVRALKARDPKLAKETICRHIDNQEISVVKSILKNTVKEEE